MWVVFRVLDSGIRDLLETGKVAKKKRSKVLALLWPKVYHMLTLFTFVVAQKPAFLAGLGCTCLKTVD